MLRSITQTIVSTIDRILEVIAPRLPGVAGAGVFWLGDGHSSFWDMWSEGRSTVVRLGRVELEIDWQR